MKMKIALIQLDIKWGDREYNLVKAKEIISHAENADLYLLPEMFTTGFATDPSGMAENDNLTLEWLKDMAKLKDAAIAATVAVEERGNYYNRLFFVKPDGNVSLYDKRHLFSYAGEDKQYQNGEERRIVNWRGCRILLQICYDLRFPVFSRSLDDYDLVIYLANWPESRVHVWDTLLKARALENQSYVAGVNRIGDDPNCHYNGGTKLINPYGKVVKQCENEKQEVVYADIDLDKLNEFKNKFTVLKDADKFKLL